MKNKNQTVFEDSDQEETSTQQTNGKNGTANGNDQQTGDFKNFDLSKKTVKKLKARNVEYLYPIQSKSYTSIHEQKDCLIQASTGSGKTLAYALPLVELLQSDKTFELAEGRSARVLVLSSTKDSVKQVSDEFQTVVNNLSVVPVYSAKKKSDEQEAAIANGVDVLVATPDRAKELLDNEKVDLSNVNHVVIDDADQVVADSEASENVKKILKQVFSSDRENKAQLVVLSQASSDSFRKLVKKYLSDEAVTLNLAAGNTQASADDENDEGFDESANNTSTNGSLSLLTKKENYTTYQLTTNEEIKSVGFVYAIIRKCLGDTFDAKSSVPQIAFTKDFTSAVFDLPSELDEQLQNAWKDTNRTQLAPITQLPEIDQSSITDNTGYSRGAGGNRNSGKSNGCFKCGKEGHKSFECTEAGGPQRGGGNRAGGNGCFNCGKDGHKSFECTEPKKAGGGGGGGRSNGCFNCGQDGHRSFECTEPKKAGGGGGGGGGRSNGCFNCGQDGHRSYECTEPKKAGGGGGGAGGCFNCGQDGHKSFECTEPKKAGGGGGGGRSNGCFNCGQDGHRSFECTEPKKAGGGGGGAGGCFNCGKDGHKSFECPEPKKGRPSAGGARGGRGGARGGGPKRSFGGGYENGNGAGEVTNKKIKFDDDD